MNAIIAAHPEEGWTQATDLSGNTDPNWSVVTWSDNSNNKRIVGLRIYSGSLTGTLNVSGLTALNDLICLYTQLTSLDVSGCTSLKSLACQENRLTSLLGVSGIACLDKLFCFGNQLTSLDVLGCTSLKLLSCQNNQLTSLDVSGCPSLEIFYCQNNQLTSLDVSGKAIESFYCSNNQLTSLDVSGSIFRVFSCDNNQLTSLNISGCTPLESLTCQNNQLTSLDVSGCPALFELNCSDNQLTSIDLSGNNNISSWTGNRQTPSTITMNYNNGNYEAAIALINPTDLANDLLYQSGVLYCTNAMHPVYTSPFTVETGQPGKSLSGTLTLQYNITTGIGGTQASDPVVSVRYYDLQGKPIAQPQKDGIYIVREVRQSGKVEVRKITPSLVENGE